MLSLKRLRKYLEWCPVDRGEYLLRSLHHCACHVRHFLCMVVTGLGKTAHHHVSVTNCLYLRRNRDRNFIKIQTSLKRVFLTD